MTEIDKNIPATPHAHRQAGVVQLPAPTVWPMVLATGLALVFTGMVTHWVIALLGVLCIVPAIVGWFLEVLPHEKHVGVPVSAAVSGPASREASLAVRP